MIAQGQQMTTDRIYQGADIEAGPFEFNDRVAAAFPDMIQRSVPGYSVTIDAIGRLAGRYLRAGTTGYDLGCSLGAATLAMRHGARADGVRLVGVDDSAAMLRRCKDKVAADDQLVPVELVLGDVTDTPIENASMVVLNYTLQFVPTDKRDELLRNIAEGLVPGGLLVLSEKIRFDDTNIGRAIIELHEDFKRANAYTELEISRKREALENVLVPDSIDVIKQRLTEAGFASHEVWMQQYNFVSLIALK